MSHTKATSHFQTVAIIGKHGASGIHETLLELADFLQSIGRTVIVESDTAKELKDKRLTSFDLEEICRRADLAIVVGGDGTMLGIARQLASFEVPLIGVNLGRLGFMTDIPKERMLPLLQDIFEGQLASEKRSLLEGVILRGEQTIFKGLAFNDIVVSRTAAAGMVELRVEVDGHFMYNQRSDLRRLVQPLMRSQRVGRFCILNLMALCWYRLRRILYRIDLSSCLVAARL